jgi:hypothetical protein
MKIATGRRFGATSLLVGAVILAVACSAQQSADPSPQASSVTSPSAAPTSPTVSQFDGRWMGLTPNQPHGWEELNRRITSEFQQFNLRPADDTESMYGCNGCASWTVALTAYAPGKFDPTDARTGQPVGVNADGDGFLREDPAKHEATLSWPYADDAWATVRAMTTETVELDRMVELAHALKPAERIPIRLPLRLANVPIPLAEISVDKSEYGTRLEFAPCGMTVVSGTEECMTEGDRMGVQIWPEDRPGSHIQVDDAVPMTIGGRDGLYNDGANRSGEQAAAQIAPGMLVVFEIGRAGPAEATTSLKDILAGVSWAPDPANEATWPAVSDWTT